MIFDSHCHGSPVWFEPADLLLVQMDRNGVEKAALVQLLGQYDNDYQNAFARAHADRLVSVVAVNPARPEAVEALRREADEGAVGVRLRPEARSPGPEPYAIWAAAAACGLAVDCVGTAANFTSAEFAELLAAFPSLPVVIEHLGGWARPDCDHTDETRARIRALARFPNVSLKAPSLGQLLERGRELPAAPPVFDLSKAGILIEMTQAFGAHRIMWGSDYPVVSSREGYANALAWTRQVFDGEAPEVREQVFGGAAMSVFGRHWR